MSANLRRLPSDDEQFFGSCIWGTESARVCPVCCGARAWARARDADGVRSEEHAPPRGRAKVEEPPRTPRSPWTKGTQTRPAHSTTVRHTGGGGEARAQLHQSTDTHTHHACRAICSPVPLACRHVHIYTTCRAVCKAVHHTVAAGAAGAACAAPRASEASADMSRCAGFESKSSPGLRMTARSARPGCRLGS